MPSQSNRLKNTRSSIDKTLFLPLEKLRLKFEQSNFPLFKNPTVKRPTIMRDDLINAESELGRTIFGPVPVGHQREFFQYTKNVWMWHENWTDLGKRYEITIRYEVRKDGVYKKIQGHGYQKISGSELENFRKALHAYLKLVKEKLY
ncbi:hypothetical protein IKG45_00420 [Candidatus Saccharibacteria bacterium]|nr:hypothetical protein [Candidatus Saccharibacteria bacterium]